MFLHDVVRPVGRRLNAVCFCTLTISTVVNNSLWITLWITVWIFERPLRPRCGAGLISDVPHFVVEHLHRRRIAFHVKHRAMIDAVHATSWVAGRR